MRKGEKVKEEREKGQAFTFWQQKDSTQQRLNLTLALRFLTSKSGVIKTFYMC